MGDTATRPFTRNIWWHLFLGVTLAVMPYPLAAQGQDYERLPVEFTPHVGYRTSMSFISEPGVGGLAPRIVLHPSPSYGAAFGFWLNDEDLVEFRWSRQQTQVHIGDPAIAPIGQRATLDQFHMDCSHEYVVPEWPVWARPFIMASVGATRVSSNAVGFTRFSFGIGAGVRAFPFRHVGFKIQAEWLPLLIDPKVTALCSGGCIIHLRSQLASQGEITIGPVFRF